jgi:hypothetical protein
MAPELPPLRMWRRVPPPKYKKDWPGKRVVVRAPTERVYAEGKLVTRPDKLLGKGAALTVSQRYPLPVRDGGKDACLVCLWTCPCCGRSHKREYLESGLDAGDFFFAEDAGPAPEPHVAYLAAPYSHPDPAVRQERWLEASRAAALLMTQGMTVLSPLSMGHPIGVVGKPLGMPTDFEAWAATSLTLLRAAQALFVLALEGWRESEGVAAELGAAREWGKRVIHLHPAGPYRYVVCNPWQSDLPPENPASPYKAAAAEAGKPGTGFIWHEIPEGVRHE